MKASLKQYTVRYSVICTVFCCAVNTCYYTVLLQFVISVHTHCGFKTFTLITKVTHHSTVDDNAGKFCNLCTRYARKKIEWKSAAAAGYTAQ